MDIKQHAHGTRFLPHGYAFLIIILVQLHAKLTC